MSDVVIRGMEMPENCVGCPLFICEIGNPMACRVGYRMLDNRMVNESKPEWCPILPLPEGHGRLGDLDRLFEVMGQDADRWIVDEVSMIETDDVLDAIQNAPTIVPAEGGENE